MMLHAIFTLVAAAHLGAALPSYRIPLAMSRVLLANSDCILPEGFEVQNFQIWTPAAGNNRSEVLAFDYRDNSTSTDTKCRFNGTSANVAPAGLAPRYACDNQVVQFIWQNNTLTLIEKACPQNNMPRGFEAAGTVTPNLMCGTSAKNSTVGEGRACVAQGALVANFTSLEPSPS